MRRKSLMFATVTRLIDAELKPHLLYVTLIPLLIANLLTWK